MAGSRVVRMRALDAWLRDHDGIVTAQQATRLGITEAIRLQLVAEGVLVRAHPGVFVRGPGPAGPEQELRAAVVAGGRGAVASRLSAAWWLGMAERAPARPQLSVGRDRRLRLRGVDVRHSTLAGDVRSCRGLPVTTPERTILDLAATPGVGDACLHGAIDLALTQGLTTVGRLADVAVAPPGRRRPGGPRLRSVLRGRGHLGDPGASVLEQLTGRLLDDLHRRHGIDAPVVEHAVLGARYRLDFAWPRLHLAVEVDGYVWHAGSGEMAHDLDRRNRLAAAGWTIVVFTWHQVVHQPDAFCERVLAAYRVAEERAGGRVGR